jgi:cAMP-dependent protein kinase regulator
VAEGDFVCKDGDPGDSIYFVSSGEVEVLKYVKKKQQDAHLSRLSEGDFFGEFGFFSDRKRHASVRALTDLELLEISKEDLDTLTVSHPRMRNILLNFYKKRVIDTLLAFSPLFGCLPPDQRALLVSRFTLRRLGENRLIFEQGAPPTSFFVVKRGEVEVYTSETGRAKVTLAILKQGDFFGEISLILKQPRMASVRTTKATELLELKQADFEYIVGTYSPIKSGLENLAQDRLQSTRQILSAQWRQASGADMV